MLFPVLRCRCGTRTQIAFVRLERLNGDPKGVDCLARLVRVDVVLFQRFLEHQVELVASDKITSFDPLLDPVGHRIGGLIEYGDIPLQVVDILAEILQIAVACWSISRHCRRFRCLAVDDDCDTTILVDLDSSDFLVVRGLVDHVSDEIRCMRRDIPSSEERQEADACDEQDDSENAECDEAPDVSDSEKGTLVPVVVHVLVSSVVVREPL